MADLPALPEGFAARPLTADDVAPVAALLAAAEQVDDTGEYPDAADLAEWWTGWDLDPARDGVAVTDGSDLIVGFATAMAPRTFRDPYTVAGYARTSGGRASAERCWSGSSPVVPRSAPNATRRRRLKSPCRCTRR